MTFVAGDVDDLLELYPLAVAVAAHGAEMSGYCVEVSRYCVRVTCGRCGYPCSCECRSMDVVAPAFVRVGFDDDRRHGYGFRYFADVL